MVTFISNIQFLLWLIYLLTVVCSFGMKVSIPVANCIAGYRIGKGKGYADLEFAMLVKMGAVNQNTVLAATVHDCQVHRQSLLNFFISELNSCIAFIGI